MALFDRFKSLFSGGRLDVSSRFALLRTAISGTMSNFYMAKDLRTGKIVGLKIADAAKIAAVEARFKGCGKPSEGEIAVQFKHPHIVETYEYGITTDGSPYIVMEYLEGAGLNSLIVARSPHLDGRRVCFLRQAAEALAAVHEAGFMHRDICPRNLLTTADGENVKLTDFGLTLPATKIFMQPGNRTGTPNYMAPELARRRPTDHRVDIFAFGVTAYELCTFELPWRSGITGMIAMTHDQPPIDIRKYRPQIDLTLAKAIHWCIEADVAKRCPSMERFLHMIGYVRHEDGKQ